MATDELLRLVKFDPNELRSAIAKCDQEADALLKKRNEIVELGALYRQILKTHGYEQSEAVFTSPQPASKDAAGKPHDRRFHKMKIADAAVTAMTEAGGKMHGLKLVQALIAGGLKFGGKHAMDVLRGAMVRDERIERVPGEKNTWRVKTAS
jgi:hypothetical protein